MATSYNGWAASPVPSAIGIAAFSVLGTKPFKDGGFPVGLKGGDVSTIFRYLVTRLHNEVEPMMIDPATGLIGYGCWAYEYRVNVNNPSVLSCHASGTAIDYNAPRHPNGTSVGANGGGGWTAAQAAKIRGILADLGGVVRWLTSNDPMHFEIAGGPVAVAAVAARIGRAPEKPGTPNVPSTPNPEEDDVTDDDIEKIAKRAAELVWEQPIMEAKTAADEKPPPAWAVLQRAADLLSSRPAAIAPQTVADAIAQTRNDVADIKHG